MYDLAIEEWLLGWWVSKPSRFCRISLCVLCSQPESLQPLSSWKGSETAGCQLLLEITNMVQLGGGASWDAHDTMLARKSCSGFGKGTSAGVQAMRPGNQKCMSGTCFGTVPGFEVSIRAQTVEWPIERQECTSPWQQRLSCSCGGSCEQLHMRPGLLRIDVVPGEGRDSAPVIDPSVQQRSPAVLQALSRADTGPCMQNE